MVASRGLILVLALAFAPTLALADGAATYLANCQVCHGVGGIGGIGADFTSGNPIIDADGDTIKGTVEDYKLVITNGAALYGGLGLMVAWGGALTPTEIDEVATHICDNFTPSGCPAAIPIPILPNGGLWILSGLMLGLGALFAQRRLRTS